MKGGAIFERTSSGRDANKDNILIVKMYIALIDACKAHVDAYVWLCPP